MTPTQVALVQESWMRVLPTKDAAAQLFYRRLFELDARLQTLFKGDMVEQGRKLMAMIAVAVASLTRIEALLPKLRELGSRHLDYGVSSQDYDTVGAALLWTLEQGLGAEFTIEVRNAWADVYAVLATTMQSAEQPVLKYAVGS